MLLMLCCWALALSAQAKTDPRCIAFMGIPLEGPVDSLRPRLKEAGFSEWGSSDDGEDHYFRGQFYGIRAKLTLSQTALSDFVSSASITVGPYSTKSMLERNTKYFLYKLGQDYGEMVERDGAWYYMDDYGSVKFSILDNANGSRDIRVFFYPTAPFYKDALVGGLHGTPQEIVTDNPLVENPVERYFENGQTDNPDMVNRHYDRYGYLLSADINEQEGKSHVEFTYDDNYMLRRRTLTNDAAGIRYTHDYTYNDQGEVLTQQQKVYDKKGECVMTLNIRNQYLTRDDNDNWLTNSLSITYWEKGSTTQQSTALQKRTITYWD